MILQLK